jgi:hypothetical protein
MIVGPGSRRKKNQTRHTATKPAATAIGIQIGRLLGMA